MQTLDIPAYIRPLNFSKALLPLHFHRYDHEERMTAAEALGHPYIFEAPDLRRCGNRFGQYGDFQ